MLAAETVVVGVPVAVVLPVFKVVDDVVDLAVDAVVVTDDALPGRH